MDFDTQSFKKAMRQCAGAVALVTVGTEPGRRTGLTVTSACSLSDDPPSLLVCVNRNASAHAPSARSEFRSQFPRRGAHLACTDFQRSEGYQWRRSIRLRTMDRRRHRRPGAGEAVAAFDCVLTQEFETKTHSVFVGEVRDIRISVETNPLIYLRSSFQSVRDIQGSFALGDLDARRQSWSQFS